MFTLSDDKIIRVIRTCEGYDLKSSEEKQETREMRSLRREIIKLRREVSQLRKKNMRLEFEAEPESEEEVGFEYITEEENNSKERFTCPDCGGYDVLSFSAGIHNFYKCGSCKSHGKKNSPKAS